MRAVVSGDEGEQVAQVQGDQVEEGPEDVWKARDLQGGLEGAVLEGLRGLEKDYEPIAKAQCSSWIYASSG